MRSYVTDGFFLSLFVLGLASPIEGQDTYRLKVAEDTLYVDTLITSDSCKKFTFVVFRALNYVPRELQTFPETFTVTDFPHPLPISFRLSVRLRWRVAIIKY